MVIVLVFNQLDDMWLQRSLLFKVTSVYVEFKIVQYILREEGEE